MTQMTLKDIVIEPGETIDFVVECLAHETSDSFLVARTARYHAQ